MSLVNRDYAPPLRTTARKRRPWRLRADPLAEEIGDVHYSGPSIRGPAGATMVSHHIIEATQAPRRPRHIRWLKALVYICLIVIVVVAAWRTF